MKPDQRDRLLAAADDAARQLNGISLEESFQLAHQIFCKLASRMDQMKTREQLAAILDTWEDLSHREEALAIGLFHFAPQLFRFGAKVFAEKLNDEFEPIREGRPGLLSPEEKKKVCVVLGQLLGRGDGLTEAMATASQRFHVSKRTIERVWAERKQLHSAAPEATFDEVIEWVEKASSDDSK